jgi:glutathione S-transferase
MLLYTDALYLSPYAMSAFVALRTKDIAFEVQTIDLHLEAQKSSSFATNSLTSRVPSLVHGDYVLSESSAIAEYLEEIQPQPALFPQDVRDRNRARQIQAWLRSDLLGLRTDRPTEVIFLEPSKKPLSSAGKAAAEKLFEVAQRLLGKGSLNLFNQWCIADVDLSLMINRLLANGDPVPEQLVQYVQHQWQQPAIQEWIKFSRDHK